MDGKAARSDSCRFCTSEQLQVSECIRFRGCIPRLRRAETLRALSAIKISIGRIR